MKKISISFFILINFIDAFSQIRSKAKVDENITTVVPGLSSNKINYFAIKTDLFDYSNGTYMIYVEKNLSDWFGLEAGAGVTLNNFLNDFLSYQTASGSDLFLWNVSNTTNFNKATSFYTHIDKEVISGIGYAASISPRIYFLKDPSEGSYLSLNLTYKSFNVSSIDKKNIVRQMTHNRLNSTINFGTKVPLTDNFVSDIFIGAGVAFVNDVRNIEIRNYNNSDVTYGIATISPFRFHAVIGLTMGWMKY